MKTIVLIFFLCVVGYSQQETINKYPFSATDTIGSITSVDSVQIQMAVGGPWFLLTQAANDTALITADDKSGEVTVSFILPNEVYWSHSKQIRFRVFSTGVDTITSTWQADIAKTLGSLTLDMKPDTVGTNTFYGLSNLHGI